MRAVGAGLLLALLSTGQVAAWGQAVHHDQATDLAEALRSTPSIPQEIREKFDTDTIYALSLAPDDWRDVTDTWGTYHYNMTENAYYEFQRIRDAWATGDFDNAVARIGIVLHYVGDVVYEPHNKGIRDWYEEFIPPLGSEAPLWGSGEGGGIFLPNEIHHNAHYNLQVAEAYSDSDSNWIPIKPENYGPDDDGSLDYFLNLLWKPNTWDTDYIDPSDPDFGGTIFEWYIAACNPHIDWSSDDREDNRWFYWLKTRDPTIPKQDIDNTIRIVYNGVYRAIRDGERTRLGNPSNFDTEIWPWPTASQWLSVDESWYGEGMDTMRYAHGISGGTEPATAQNTRMPLSSLAEYLEIGGAVLISIGLALWQVENRKGRRK